MSENIVLWFFNCKGTSSLLALKDTPIFVENEWSKDEEVPFENLTSPTGNSGAIGESSIENSAGDKFSKLWWWKTLVLAKLIAWLFLSFYLKF